MIKIKRILDKAWIKPETKKSKESPETESEFYCELLNGAEYYEVIQHSTLHSIQLPESLFHRTLKNKIKDWKNVEIDGDKTFDADAVVLLPLDTKVAIMQDLVKASTLSDDEKKT